MPARSSESRRTVLSAEGLEDRLRREEHAGSVAGLEKSFECGFKALG